MPIVQRLVSACCALLIAIGSASALASRYGDDAVLHAIGVYEGSYPSGERHSFGYHPDGAIVVRVHTKDRPVVLALSSYEPVVWTVEPDPGVIIVEIILSGYHPSKVAGVDNSVPVVHQDFGFGYKPDERRAELERQLTDYTWLEIETFQGSYKGEEFSVH